MPLLVGCGWLRATMNPGPHGIFEMSGVTEPWLTSSRSRHCADACRGEQDVKMMAECIRLDRDCAEICRAAAAWMSRGSK